VRHGADCENIRQYLSQRARHGAGIREYEEEGLRPISWDECTVFGSIFNMVY